MRNFTSAIFATFFVWSSPLVQADFVNLYTGTGLPGNQPWLSFASDGILSGGTATESTVAGGARLQTDLAVSAGYSNYTPFSTLKNGAFPALNRSVGFELNFSLIISTESHSDNNRAGFSAILLGSDQQGIELGFWTNEIWAQSSSPLFQHAEGVAIDTTISRNYRIQILNNAYTLFEGSNSLLSGNLRDYSSFGAPYSRRVFYFSAITHRAAAPTLRWEPSRFNPISLSFQNRQVSCFSQSEFSSPCSFSDLMFEIGTLLCAWLRARISDDVKSK